jgi:hypothetical protein
MVCGVAASGIVVMRPLCPNASADAKRAIPACRPEDAAVRPGARRNDLSRRSGVERNAFVLLNRPLKSLPNPLSTDGWDRTDLSPPDAHLSPAISSAMPTGCRRRRKEVPGDAGGRHGRGGNTSETRTSAAATLNAVADTERTNPARRAPYASPFPTRPNRSCLRTSAGWGQGANPRTIQKTTIAAPSARYRSANGAVMSNHHFGKPLCFAK